MNDSWGGFTVLRRLKVCPSAVKRGAVKKMFHNEEKKDQSATLMTRAASSRWREAAARTACRRLCPDSVARS